MQLQVGHDVKRNGGRKRTLLEGEVGKLICVGCNLLIRTMGFGLLEDEISSSIGLDRASPVLLCLFSKNMKIAHHLV